MRTRLLAAAALFLGAVAAAGFLTAGDETQWRGMLAFLALLGLCELPAWWWRGRGGGAGATLLIAILCPLLVFEIWLGITAHLYRHSGGDLQGIERMLMIWVVPPLALVSGSITALLALLLLRPEREPDE